MARIAFIEVTATVTYGGVQTAVWRLADTLAGLGHEVAVYGGEGPVVPPVGKQIAVHTFPFKPRERILDLGSRYQRLMERRSFARHARAHLARSHYDWAVITKPFDFFWPRMLPSDAPTRFAFLSEGTDFFPGDRWLAKRIDAWLACSHFNAWQIRSRYKRQPHVVFNGVDTGQFRPAPTPSPLRASLDLNGDHMLFAFAGRLVGWKGLHVAVAAMAEPALRDMPVRLLIIGNGPERERLRQQAAALGVPDRIHFHDPVAHDRLPQLYGAIDAGVFPSIGDEAFGITIAEAMSCGKPVVASHVGGIPEVVGNEGSAGLLVGPADPKALALAMRELALDPVRRKAMGDAARARIEREFTWRAAAKRVSEALDL
jgi:glycosyltransferase involved in cell wall biosynthesis